MILRLALLAAASILLVSVFSASFI